MPVFVHQAELALPTGADERAPGGAVTAALCGHWEHEGPCRWPHNNHIDARSTPARLRTVFVAPEDEAPEVRRRIHTAVHEHASWQVVASGPVEADADDRRLGERLGSR